MYYALPEKSPPKLSKWKVTSFHTNDMYSVFPVGHIFGAFKLWVCENVQCMKLLFYVCEYIVTIYNYICVCIHTSCSQKTYNA